MVRLPNISVDETGIEEAIDAAEAFERARGGVIDPEYRQRVRQQLIRGRVLKKVTEQRIGRDKKSSRQRQAERDRDQRRKERVQVSREELQRRGQLAGSRGSQGVTRSPTRIQGRRVGGDVPPDFQPTKPKATFESRQEFLKRRAREQLEPQRQQAILATISKQQDARLRTIEQVTSTRQAPPPLQTPTPLQVTRTPVRGQRRPTGIISQSGVLETSGEQRGGVFDTITGGALTPTKPTVETGVRTFENYFRLKDIEFRQEAQQNKTFRGSLRKGFLDFAGFTEQELEKQGTRQIKQATSPAGLFRELSRPSFAPSPLRQGVTKLFLSGQAAEIKEKPVSTTVKGAVEGAALFAPVGAGQKAVSASRSARVFFGSRKGQAIVNTAEFALGEALVFFRGQEALKVSEERGESVIKSAGRVTAKDVSTAAGFGVAAEGIRVGAPKVFGKFSSQDKLSFSKAVGERERDLVRVGTPKAEARAETIVLETKLDEFSSAVRGNKGRSFDVNELTPSNLRGEERSTFQELVQRFGLTPFGSRNIQAQGGRLPTERITKSDIDLAVPTFKTGRTKGQVISRSVERLNEDSIISGSFTKGKSSISKSGELVADVKSGGTFARREFGTRLGKSKDTSVRFEKAEAEGARNLIRFARGDDKVKALENVLASSRASRKRFGSKRTQADRDIARILGRERKLARQTKSKPQRVGGGVGQVSKVPKPLQIKPLSTIRTTPTNQKSVLRSTTKQSSVLKPKPSSSVLGGGKSSFVGGGASSTVVSRLKSSSLGSSSVFSGGSSSFFRGRSQISTIPRPKPRPLPSGSPFLGFGGGFGRKKKGSKQKKKKTPSVLGQFLQAEGIQVAQTRRLTGFGIRQVSKSKKGSLPSIFR